MAQISNRQRDLFRGDVTSRDVKRVLKENKNDIIYTKKGKIRSLFGHINKISKSKQCETKEEREAAEQGGTEYWSFRNR